MPGQVVANKPLKSCQIKLTLETEKDGRYFYLFEENITHIGDCFSWCTELEEITLPDSLESIGDYAFSECTELEEITLPDSLESIGDFAFFGCIGLEKITIPNSVTSIGEDAFRECTELKEMIIPNNVTHIGKGAFSWCSGLEKITLPESLKSIDDDVFRACSNLEKIIAPEHLVEQIKQQVPKECIVISHQEEQRRNCQRQWARAIDRASQSQSQTNNKLLSFFKTNPGSKKWIGTKLMLYYNSQSAREFEPKAQDTKQPSTPVAMIASAEKKPKTCF